MAFSYRDEDVYFLVLKGKVCRFFRPVEDAIEPEPKSEIITRDES